MAKLFSSDYYEEGENGGGSGSAGALVKPVFSDEELQGIGDEDGDGDGAGGEDYEEAYAPFEEEHEERVERNDDLAKAKDAAMDELFGLNFEDIVGGIPTRFKYRKVTPNDYGLTAAEILEADEAQLRQLVPLKKLATYREDEWRVPGSKRRKFRDELKKQREEKEALMAKKKVRVRHKKKGKKSRKAAADADEGVCRKRPRPEVLQQNQQLKQSRSESEVVPSSKVEKRKRRKRKRSGKSKAQIPKGMSESRAKSYGL